MKESATQQHLGATAVFTVVLLVVMGSVVFPVTAATQPVPTTENSAGTFVSANSGNTVSVSLELTELNGDSAANDRVGWENVDTGNYTGETTDSSGVASTNLTDGDTYEVTYEQSSSSVDYPKDGSPDVLAIGTRTYDGDTSESLTLPDGHNLSVTVINASGAPLSNATVSVGHERDGAFASVTAETNASGVLVHPNSDGPGFEVNGTVDVYVDSPSEKYDDNFTEVTVNDDRSLTVTLEPVVNASGVVRYPNGTVAENVTLRFRSDSNFEEVVTNPDGTYEAQLVENESYEASIWQANLREVENFSEPTNVAYPRDGVADFAALGVLNASTNDVSRNFSFPVGHTLNVTVENESGAGIENASVGLRNERNGAEGSVYSYLHLDGLPTDSSGQMYHPPNTGVGMEVNGTTKLSVEPPENTSYESNFTEVGVTSDRNVTVVLESPNEIEGVWVGPNGDAISNADVWVTDFTSGVVEQTTTDGYGYFNVTVPSDGTYSIYVNDSQTGDGIADTWQVENVSVTGDTRVGELTMPPGYSTSLNVTDYDGEPVDSYVNVIGGNKGWILSYQSGRQLDSPSQYDTRTADLAAGSHTVTVRDAWTHEVLAEQPITVLGNGTHELAVDRLNGTHTAGTAGTTVARDLQTPVRDETVQDVLDEGINVRLFVLNASSDTHRHVEETLPAGYELDGSVGNVSADGPGRIENVTYHDGTLSFDVNGTVTEVRYRAVPNGTSASEVEFSGRFGNVPTMGETSLPAESDVRIFGETNGSTVYTQNPFVSFVTHHPDATNVTTVEYRVDGGVWKDIQSVPAIGGAQLAGLEDGQHTVTVRLVNESGTVVTDSTTFNVST